MGEKSRRAPHFNSLTLRQLTKKSLFVLVKLVCKEFFGLILLRSSPISWQIIIWSDRIAFKACFTSLVVMRCTKLETVQQAGQHQQWNHSSSNQNYDDDDLIKCHASPRAAEGSSSRPRNFSQIASRKTERKLNQTNRLRCVHTLQFSFKNTVNF